MTKYNPKYLGDRWNSHKSEVYEILVLINSPTVIILWMSVFNFYFKLEKVRFPHSGFDNKQKILSSITNMNTGDFSLFCAVYLFNEMIATIWLFQKQTSYMY